MVMFFSSALLYGSGNYFRSVGIHVSVLSCVKAVRLQFLVFSLVVRCLSVLSNTTQVDLFSFMYRNACDTNKCLVLSL